MNIINNEDALEYIRTKLKLDWCILEGDLSIITSIENHVYPPHTKHNKNFELMIFFGRNGIMPFAICKKTDALKSTFTEKHDFSTIMIITYALNENGEPLVKITGCDLNSRDDLINAIIDKIKPELIMNKDVLS